MFHYLMVNLLTFILRLWFHYDLIKYLSIHCSPLSDFDFDSEGAVFTGFSSPISWFSWFRHLLWAFSQAWDSYLLLWIWSRIDLMFKGLCLCFVRIWSRIDLISELFCDPKSTLHFNFFLWLHVFPNWSHISQRGENVCTLKWSPRLWAPIIQFINLSNFLNQWFAIFLLNQFKSISLIKFDYFISKVDHFILVLFN